MGLPVINIEFKKLAESANFRAERGVLAILVADTTDDATPVTYSSADEVKAADYTAENYAAILRAFESNVYKVIVVRVAAAATSTTIKTALEELSFGWVCTTASGLQSNLASAVISLNENDRRARQAKALVAGVTNLNDIHVANVANTTVTLEGDEDTTPIVEYLPRIGGMLAACPLTESVTYKTFDELDAVSSVANIDTSIDAGNIVLFKDDDVIRIARGVNTLHTLSAGQTEDMKKIAVVEGMDLMQEDIVKTFKANYLGRVKNTADNQALFVSEVLAYFQQLAKETIIEVDGMNAVEIDVTAMRDAWASAGTDVSELSDAQVKKKTYRSAVYVKATCKVLDAMEDLTMSIQMG